MPPIALYIHVPFCETKCGYCDFYSVPKGWMEFDLQKDYVEVLCREIDGRCGSTSPNPSLARRGINSLFFGGGTPSLLHPDLLEKILVTLKDYFSWTADTEITLECNPKTIDLEGLKVRRALGINRISIGVQSFQDRFLKVLGRIHTANEAKMTIKDAFRAGFDNVNLDLIYSLPGQVLSDWQQDLETAIEIGPPHLSCYALTIEEGTPFDKIYGNARAGSPRPGAETAPLPDDDESLLQFEWTRERLDKAGLPPYEISNFARPGYECTHNRNYWRYGEYLGFGTAAATFTKQSPPLPIPPSLRQRFYALRTTNIRDLQTYLEKGPSPEEDPIDLKTAQGEFVMLALRTRDGVSETRFEGEFGVRFTEVFGDVLEKLSHVGAWRRHAPHDGRVNAAPLQYINGHWTLTQSGLRVADSVIGEFICAPQSA